MTLSCRFYSYAVEMDETVISSICVIILLEIYEAVVSMIFFLHWRKKIFSVFQECS